MESHKPGIKNIFQTLLLVSSILFALVALAQGIEGKNQTGPKSQIAFSKSTLKVYAEPQKSANVLYQVREGKALRVLEEQGEWVKVTHLRNQVGWVKKSRIEMLIIKEPPKQKIERIFKAPEINLKIENLMVDDKGILTETTRLYAEPRTNAKRSYIFKKDFGVTVVAEHKDWLKIKDDIGRAGWIPKRFYESLRPPPDVSKVFQDQEDQATENKLACQKYEKVVCDCKGLASQECVKVAGEIEEALKKDAEVAAEVCKDKTSAFSCVANKTMLSAYHLENCSDTNNKEFEPLKFKAGNCTRGKDYFEIKNVWGTSAEVLPGETFIVEGVYNYEGKESLLIEFGPNGGSSRPCRQSVTPASKGSFAVAAMVVYADDEDADELQLALIRADDETTALSPLACSIKVFDPKSQFNMPSAQP